MLIKVRNVNIVLSDLLSKIKREINETMEKLKCRVTISSLRGREQNVRGLANQVCPHLDPLFLKFVHFWNPRIVVCGSFYKEKFTADGITCLSITSNN